MPKRCNVLLESVKELPPLQVLEKKGDGLCHDRPLKTQNPVGAELARESGRSATINVECQAAFASKLGSYRVLGFFETGDSLRHWYNGQPAV